jgi:hypothetical protein
MFQRIARLQTALRRFVSAPRATRITPTALDRYLQAIQIHRGTTSPTEKEKEEAATKVEVAGEQFRFHIGETLRHVYGKNGVRFDRAEADPEFVAHQRGWEMPTQFDWKLSDELMAFENAERLHADDLVERIVDMRYDSNPGDVLKQYPLCPEFGYFAARLWMRGEWFNGPEIAQALHFANVGFHIKCKRHILALRRSK